MVYCGKPSRGCQMCRTRRIKCDETKPTCLQCHKSRRQCPGYKDDFDLVFRNETKATERRARRTPHSKRTYSHQHLQDGDEIFSAFLREDNPDALILSGSRDESSSFLPISVLSVPTDEQAPCFFVTSYVMKTDHASKGYFDFLLPMMKTVSPESPLAIAFSAVAMASLANRPNSRKSALYNQAVFRYSRALKATNLALQDPEQQKTDETLATVLMLGFYETVMNDRVNATAWGSHIDGATEIARMRGKKQLRTKIGQSLFMCVRTLMTINCATTSKAPVLGMEWWLSDASKTDFSLFITNLSLRVAEFRSELNNALSSFPRTPEYFQKVGALMRRAQALEQEYQDMVQNLPENWLPRAVAWVDHIPGGDISQAEVCPGRVDMFGDIWIAWTWNHARIARLFISGAIVRCAAWISFPVDYRTTPEYATAAKLCVDLINDIIASVPYHLGWRISQGGALKAADFKGFSFSDGNFSNPKALGGFFCMYPLMCIMCTDYTTDSQRAWAKGRLHFISDGIGLNFAKVLASFQLRLPSMIIKRDTLVHSPEAAAMMLAAAARAGMASPLATFSSSLLRSPAGSSMGSLSPTPSSSNVHASSSPLSASSSPTGYPLSPFQQRDAMQAEQWAKERSQLLKKASNSQGDSVEKIIASYLAV